MSFGFSSALELPTTPSMTHKASWFPWMEPVPRMRMLTPAPGWPEVEVATTPATLPYNMLETLGEVMPFSSSALTDEMAPVMEL